MKTAIQEIIDKYYQSSIYRCEFTEWLIENKELLLKKEKEQNNQIIRDVFEHCWNHLNWNGEYDIKDMNEYLKNYNQNK